VAGAEDRRDVGIVGAGGGKALIYWGTAKVTDVLEVAAWPQVYRERNEIQEHSFKRMIDHGALNTNYGRKKLVGPDRHQQRQRAQLEQALVGAHKRVATKTEAVN